MAFLTGRNGSLKLGSSEIVKIRDWTLNTNLNTIETTSLGDTATTYTAGLFSATGSATASYYTEGTTNATNLLANIAKTGAITDSDKVSLVFEAGTGDSFAADAFISSASISASTDEVTTVSFDFTIDGPLTSVTMS